MFDCRGQDDVAATVDGRGRGRLQQVTTSQTPLAQDAIVNAPIERLGELLMSSGAVGRQGASSSSKTCVLSFVDLLRPVVDSAAAVDMYAEMLMDGSASRMNPVALINKYGSRVKSMRELNSFLLWLQLLRSECKVTLQLDQHRLAFNSKMRTEFVNPLTDAFVSYFNRPTPPARITMSSDTASPAAAAAAAAAAAEVTKDGTLDFCVDKLLFDYILRKITLNEGRRLNFKLPNLASHMADERSRLPSVPPEAIAKFLDDTATACLVHVELAQIYPKSYFIHIVAAPP